MPEQTIETCNETFERLIKRLADLDRHYNLNKIRSAYEYAKLMHEGQKRESGEPYITHPLAVATILVDLGMDTDAICAAFLHDVVEDTDATYDDVKKKFGADVANLVDGVTKLDKIKLASKEEQQAENIRKIFLSMAKDIRVIIIKLADRLHNMRTLGFRSGVKRRDVSLETMSIFVPLANRLGIRQLKKSSRTSRFHISTRSRMPRLNSSSRSRRRSARISSRRLSRG